VGNATIARRGQSSHEPTHYINVDLDIQSATALDGLVRAMGDDVSVLYVGGASRQFEAHLELTSLYASTTADRAIVRFIKLIERLPHRDRKTWDRARSREFNIGIQAGLQPHGFELRVQPRTIEAIATIKATLVVTVYAPDLQARRAPKPKPAKISPTSEWTG
jgi:hypothetical protein